MIVHSYNSLPECQCSRKHLAFAGLYFCTTVVCQLGLPTGRNFLVPRDKGTATGQKGKKELKNYNFWKKKKKMDNFWLLLTFFFDNQIVFLSRDVPVRDGTACSKSRPVLFRGKILSLSRCPFVPGQWRNFCPFVPKSCTVPSRWKP